jgi:cell division protein FtsQ
VAQATVTRSWPSSVDISLRERVPAAVVTTTTGEWAVTDVAGRVLERSTGAPSSPAILSAALRTALPLPTVQGLAQLPRPGARLPAPSGPALRVLRALQWPLSAQVSSIDVLPDGEVELSVPPDVLVQLGDADQLQQELTATQTVLSQVKPSTVRTIDVRVPEAPAVTPG